MDTRTVEQIEDWDSRPFSGGYAGLHELADAQFSGAVSAGRTWLFMLNGRTVGVFEGTIEDYEDRDGTAYRAPDPALPLLFTMLELGGETQANYYTNDTPLSEASATLSDANFTGYIELSENVLSGDYYSVYYGGRSMNAAFVGASERLLTGDEAFERADDEVGIYEVVAVDLELVDLPEIDEPEPEPEPTPVADEPEDEEPAPEPDLAEAESEPADDSPDSPASEPESEPTVAEATSGAEPTGSEPERTAEPEQPPETGDAPEPETEAAEARASDLEGRRGPAGGEGPPKGRGPGRRADDDVFSEEAQWRETKSIPSIDPDRTESSGPSGRGAAQQAAQAAQARRARSQSESDNGSREDRRKQEPAHRNARRLQPGSAASRAEPSDEAKAALRKHKEEIERLRGKVSALEDEREEFEAEREELAAERAKLEEEIERLRAELQEARANASATGSAAPAGEELTPEAALDGTNLFVRYGSKGKPTLETAHSGRADADEVNGNLKLEHHTQFDADTVSVEGRSFGEFLRDSIEFSFVEWAVRELLYEIRDTGHAGGLREVYDALPRVDRAELGGAVTVTATADGEQTEREQAFDVILRDRMGNPLLVANLNDSRDPATGDVMSSLIESSNAVCESHEQFGGAFYVTASFFEPGALETASEATSGGLLSREKKDSYVKFARKRGYHLCLVETRAGEFHVNVPEL